MKKIEIEQLIKTHGDIKFSILLNKLYKHKIYKCPKCDGTGQKEYNAYPSGLPDSGFVYKQGFRDCDLCEGHGYTEKKYLSKATNIKYVTEE